MGLRSNKVKRSQLQPGDHIYSYRRLHAYAHHGIYVEANRVIHFTRTEVATKKRWFLGSRCKICGYHKKQAAGGVVKTCVNCFLDRHKLYRFEYGVSPAHFALKNPGTCSTGRSDSANTVIRRATDFLNKKKGFGDYDLFKNNCESFAVLCKTGKSMSAQAFSALNAVKIVFKAFVKQNVERLQQDVYLHHPNKYMELKQNIDALGTSSGVKEIIASLKKLKEKYDDDQEDVNDKDLLDDDESVETMDKEGDDDGDKSIESTTNLSTTSAIKT